MKTASISEAKNRLSSYIDLVRGGHTILITDRGNPVAQLGPLEAGTKEFEGSHLARLERLGIIRRGKRSPLKTPPRPVKLCKKVDVVRLLSEMRGKY